MLVISGQAHSDLDETSMVRQLGNKAISIVDIVKNYKVCCKNHRSGIAGLSHRKALYMCQEGRQGPCWLDIPIDIQGC